MFSTDSRFTNLLHFRMYFTLEKPLCVASRQYFESASLTGCIIHRRVAVLTGSGAAQYSRLSASESADSMSLLEVFLLHLSPSKLRWSHRLKKNPSDFLPTTSESEYQLYQSLLLIDEVFLITLFKNRRPFKPPIAVPFQFTFPSSNEKKDRGLTNKIIMI